MSGAERGFAAYGRPRRVEGGLRARSARGRIGQSWWSRRFLDVLESFALGTRLTRGRSYARAGQVLSLQVAPGAVTAAVQGSRPRPYRVTIGLRPFAEPVWRRVETLLAAQALYSARLLAGDLPSDLERVFADAGAPLFPASVAELDLRCDCPDSAVPCKHLAATFYLLAEAFDADPFQILHWRGRDRERLLSQLRALRTGAQGAARRPGRGRLSSADAWGGSATSSAPSTAAPSTSDPSTSDPSTAASSTAARDEVEQAGCGAALALDDLAAVPLGEALDRFWLPPVQLPARVPILATEPDLLLRQLGPPPAAIGGPGLARRLRRAYERFDLIEVAPGEVSSVGPAPAADPPPAGSPR